MRRRQTGFNLIEVVMVIIVFSIAAVPLVAPLTQTADALLVVDELQAGAGLAEECAEHVLRQRRDSGYAGITDTNMCGNALPALPAGYARDPITITDITGTAQCPAGLGCKQVDIAVTHNGATVADVTFMLVDY